MKVWKNTNGITLIALVVTIIVLIILAGVSINNENGSLGNGRSIAYDGSTLRTISTKYTTVYPHNSKTDKPGITDTPNDSTNLNIASNNNYALNTFTNAKVSDLGNFLTKSFV